jgi:hypothetical protein
MIIGKEVKKIRLFIFTNFGVNSMRGHRSQDTGDRPQPHAVTPRPPVSLGPIIYCFDNLNKDYGEKVHEESPYYFPALMWTIRYRAVIARHREKSEGRLRGSAVIPHDSCGPVISMTAISLIHPFFIGHCPKPPYYSFGSYFHYREQDASR